jgi:hypothetical protein
VWWKRMEKALWRVLALMTQDACRGSNQPRVGMSTQSMPKSRIISARIEAKMKGSAVTRKVFYIFPS